MFSLIRNMFGRSATTTDGTSCTLDYRSGIRRGRFDRLNILDSSGRTVETHTYRHDPARRYSLETLLTRLGWTATSALTHYADRDRTTALVQRAAPAPEPEPATAPAAVSNTASGNADTVVQAREVNGGLYFTDEHHTDNRRYGGTGEVTIGDVSGNVGTVIGETSGPLHTGTGDQVTNVNNSGAVGTQTGIVNYGGTNTFGRTAIGPGATINNNDR